MNVIELVVTVGVLSLHQSRPTLVSSTSAYSPCAAWSAWPPGRCFTFGASSRPRSWSSRAPLAPAATRWPEKTPQRPPERQPADGEAPYSTFHRKSPEVLLRTTHPFLYWLWNMTGAAGKNALWHTEVKGETQPCSMCFSLCAVWHVAPRWIFPHNQSNPLWFLSSVVPRANVLLPFFILPSWCPSITWRPTAETTSDHFTLHLQPCLVAKVDCP